jgi:toxin ParE1/3/4
MPCYEFTHEAERDLEAITDFICEQWGRQQAEKYFNGLNERAQNLADNPGLGMNRGVLLEGLLSFPYLSHVLYYVQQADGITIIRVLHKRMDQG